jgi:EmrB/QacA subfamily drug resistance transporter
MATGTQGRTPDAEPEGGLDPKRWWALAIIAIAQLMIVLDATVVNIALPRAQADLDISTADRQWVVTAYTLAFGGLLLLGGRIADFAGRKRVFIIGLIGFALASALGGFATEAWMLFAARALQGAFAALMAPAALSLISVAFTDAKERATAFGVYGAIAGGGAALGLILGGVLTEYASWRWCLGVNVPIAIGAALAAIPVVRESRADGDRRYDIPGAVTVTLGLVALVYGFTTASEDGWSSPQTVGLIASSLVLLAAFVVIETRTSHPLLPMRIILDRNRGGTYVVSLLVAAGLLGMFLFLTYYLQEILGYSPLKAGFAFLPFSLGVIFSAVLAGQLLPKVGPRPLMTGGFLAAGVALLWLTQIGVEPSFLVHILPAEIVMSVGLGFVFVPLASTALVGVGSGPDAGVASAMVNATQQIGGSLGTALLNTIAITATSGYITANIATQGPEAVVPAGTVHGFAVAFAWAAVFMFAGAVISWVCIRASKEQLAEIDPALVAAG